MDLDPMKRKLVTRGIGVFDMILGLCTLVFNLHTMWDYYLHDVRKSSNKELVINGFTYNITEAGTEGDLDEISGQLRHMIWSLFFLPELPFYSFVMICVVVFTLNLFQIAMGFALQVATFGRDQGASINISNWWLRTSFTLLFLVSMKTILLGSAFICEEMPADWITFGIGLLEIVFRVFGGFWVPKFITFLKYQSEFDSRCHVIRI